MFFSTPPTDMADPIVKIFNIRGAVRECMPCGKRGPKHAIEVHYIRSHLSRDRVPYLCTRCDYRDTSKRRLEGHLEASHPRCQMAGSVQGTMTQFIPRSDEVRTLSREESLAHYMAPATGSVSPGVGDDTTLEIIQNLSSEKRDALMLWLAGGFSTPKPVPKTRKRKLITAEESPQTSEAIALRDPWDSPDPIRKLKRKKGKKTHQDASPFPSVIHTGDVNSKVHSAPVTTPARKAKGKSKQITTSLSPKECPRTYSATPRSADSNTVVITPQDMATTGRGAPEEEKTLNLRVTIEEVVATTVKATMEGLTGVLAEAMRTAVPNETAFGVLVEHIQQTNTELSRVSIGVSQLLDRFPTYDYRQEIATVLQANKESLSSVSKSLDSFALTTSRLVSAEERISGNYEFEHSVMRNIFKGTNEALNGLVEVTREANRAQTVLAALLERPVQVHPSARPPLEATNTMPPSTKK